MVSLGATIRGGQKCNLPRSFANGTLPSRVEVFANHDGKKALRQISRLLDVNDDGILTATEKEQARIIIYGHSWGGAQAVTLADNWGDKASECCSPSKWIALRRFGNPILAFRPTLLARLTFIRRRDGSTGRSTIRAVDSDQTKILGNFRMTYKDHDINCDNYPRLVRVLTRPHHEIENDPRVWGQVGFLIDSELSGETSAAQSSWVSGSLFTK